jgi:hypothetical protein
MMHPGLDGFSLFGNDIDAIGQNLFLREKEGLIASFFHHRIGNFLLRIAPKAHRDIEAQLLPKEASWKIPGDKQALALGRIGLPGIGRSHTAARQKILIDPLLLHIEMMAVASGEKKNRRKNLAEPPYFSYALSHDP